RSSTGAPGSLSASANVSHGAHRSHSKASSPRFAAPYEPRIYWLQRAGRSSLRTTRVSLGLRSLSERSETPNEPPTRRGLPRSIRLCARRLGVCRNNRRGRRSGGRRLTRHSRLCRLAAEPCWLRPEGPRIRAALPLQGALEYLLRDAPQR